MEYLISILTGIITGCLSSYLTYRFIRGKRPDVKISKTIVKYTDGIYKIKVVNKTKQNLKNVDYHLFFTEITYSVNNDFTTPMHIYKEEIIFNNKAFIIDKYEKPKINRIKGTQQNINTDYALFLRIPEKYDIEQWLNNSNNALCFEFTAQNEYSDASIATSHCYKKDNVVSGKFKNDDSVEFEKN